MIENSELVEIIHRAPLFMALDDDSASALRKSMDEVRLTRGQTLFSEGDQAERPARTTSRAPRSFVLLIAITGSKV